MAFKGSTPVDPRLAMIDYSPMAKAAASTMAGYLEAGQQIDNSVKAFIEKKREKKIKEENIATAKGVLETLSLFPEGTTDKQKKEVATFVVNNEEGIGGITKLKELQDFKPRVVELPVGESGSYVYAFESSPGQYEELESVTGISQESVFSQDKLDNLRSQGYIPRDGKFRFIGDGLLQVDEFNYDDKLLDFEGKIEIVGQGDDSFYMYRYGSRQGDQMKLGRVSELKDWKIGATKEIEDPSTGEKRTYIKLGSNYIQPFTTKAELTKFEQAKKLVDDAIADGIITEDKRNPAMKQLIGLGSLDRDSFTITIGNQTITLGNNNTTNQSYNFYQTHEQGKASGDKYYITNNADGVPTIFLNQNVK